MTEVEALELYKNLFLKLNRLPKLSELQEKGLTERQIRTRFGNLTNLSRKAKETYKKEFESLIDERFFTKKNLDSMKKDLSKYKRFVISTAVNGCHSHTGFIEAIDNYCEKNKAALIILPSNDPAHSLQNNYHWNFPPEFEDRFFIFDDISLNSNLFISTIRLGAKQIDPITGLGRVAQAKGSFIYASPKQRLKYIGVDNAKIPHAMITTGALTVPNYKTQRFWSERTAYIATTDHVLGAIIVEIEDDEHFHFRQIQADSYGSFTDLGTQYNADGTTVINPPKVFVLGDLHSGDDTNQEALKCFLEKAVKELKPDKIVLHDVFSGNSVNHHELGKTITEAKNKLTLEEELKILSDYLNYIQSFAKEIIIVKSNHDEWLEKYLNSALYIHQKWNYRIALELAMALFDGYDPLKWAMENKYNLKNPQKFTWLKRKDDYKIAGVQLAAHGDKGVNGAKGNIKQSELAYNNCIVGHSHSAEILRKAWCVGTTTKLDISYQTGPGNWTHSSCILYKNGQRQMLNCINGDYKLRQ
jgi:hypothetical protein